ncbi:MAG: leucine-rich repeat domain-containing protein [Chloroflexi bacterium]|nr:leucine-rich repeat domain-containing protein [Chloroflexota bacterium]
MSRRQAAGVIGALAVLLVVVASCAEPPQDDQPAQPNAGSSDGICGRTPEIRTALLASISEVPDCADVTDEHLASIEGVLDLSNLDIEAIDAADLSGLDRVLAINLSGNRLGRLPDHLFAGLPSLCQVNVQDNPGAPFMYTMRLVESRSSDLHNVAVELAPSPPFNVNVLLHNEYVALSSPVVQLSAGEQRSTLAQLGGVFGAEQGEVWIVDAAFAGANGCGVQFIHPGIELSFDRDERVVVAAQPVQQDDEPRTGNALCAGIPTQVIVVGTHSFAHDEQISRLVTNRLGACYTAVTVAPEPGRDLGGTCTLSQYVESTSRGTSQTSDTDGDCGWLQIGVSSGQGGTPEIDGCTTSALHLRVDSETFNRTGRVDLVHYDAESRCYVFFSAAQDPDRDEPYRFSRGEACRIGAGVPLSGECGSILIWSGIGRGGVSSESEARAEVARIRPAAAGEADAGRAGLIEACLQLPPLSLRIDAGTLIEQRTLHTYSADPHEQCFMALVAALDPLAGIEQQIGPDQQCTVSTAFQLLGFPYLLPTTRSGDCDGLIHFAWFMPAGGQISAAEFAGMVEATAHAIADSETQSHCVNDVCVLEPSGMDDDADP